MKFTSVLSFLAVKLAVGHFTPLRLFGLFLSLDPTVTLVNHTHKAFFKVAKEEEKKAKFIMPRPKF